jgi:hypothetical protein
MHARCGLWIIPVCLLILATGCREEAKPFQKVVVPVKGKVTVDGKAPTSPIKIDVHYLGAPDMEHPTASSGLTGEGGEFSLSTYDSGDGVPVGEYALTYFWGDFNLVSMNYGGKDKLNRRYSKAADSVSKFKAEEGKPIDLGVVELKTK